MMKRAFVAVLVKVFMVLTLTVFPLSALAAGPIKLKAVTFLPDYVEGVDAFKLFMELVKKKSNGELVIDYIGSS